jgi:hypothetical protein
MKVIAFNAYYTWEYDYYSHFADENTKFACDMLPESLASEPLEFCLKYRLTGSDRSPYFS